MNTPEIVNKLETYRKKLCWTPSFTLSTGEQKRLYDLLSEAAAALTPKEHYRSPGGLTEETLDGRGGY